MAYFRAFCKVSIIVRSLAESSVFLYGNISTFRSDWREIEYRRIAVGFRLWIGYQIFTYVKNKEIELSAQPHEVFGMLLYAKTDEAVLPNNSYKMSGNIISVKTLDLDCDFSEIANQLNKIVESHFGIEARC